MIKLPPGTFTMLIEKRGNAWPVIGKIDDDILMLVLGDKNYNDHKVLLSDGRIGYVSIIGLEKVV